MIGPELAAGDRGDLAKLRERLLGLALPEVDVREVLLDVSDGETVRAVRRDQDRERLAIELDRAVVVGLHVLGAGELDDRLRDIGVTLAEHAALDRQRALEVRVGGGAVRTLELEVSRNSERFDKREVVRTARALDERDRLCELRGGRIERARVDAVAPGRDERGGLELARMVEALELGADPCEHGIGVRELAEVVTEDLGERDQRARDQPIVATCIAGVRRVLELRARLREVLGVAIELADQRRERGRERAIAERRDRAAERDRGGERLAIVPGLALRLEARELSTQLGAARAARRARRTHEARQRRAVAALSDRGKRARRARRV